MKMSKFNQIKSNLAKIKLIYSKFIKVPKFSKVKPNLTKLY